jgi:hypothetical protein
MQARDLLPMWWSRARDAALEKLWHDSNLLSGAMYAMSSKMCTIPFHIEPLDMSITQHMRDADMFQRRLYEGAEFGQGWDEFFSLQVQSLLGQDNGRFFEIIDAASDKTGRVTGAALTVAHLSPDRCTRTGDPEFPILYQRIDGKRVKLHFTRVGYDSQLPSTRAEMFRVGFCAISRATHYARLILDINRYYAEKLGSRPLRGILLAGGGLDAEVVGNAIEAISSKSDAEGFMNFSLLPIIGEQELDTPSLELISLSSLPEGFDEETSTGIAMAAIALAMGVDIRELWPSSQQGATRADALLQHIKQRGKGPGHIITRTEQLINSKFLPAHLKIVFDYQDDAQDRQRAEISESRSKTRRLNLEDSSTDTRIERELMLQNGEINSAQFNSLELASGRLPDGRDIQILFYSEDETESELLTIAELSDPLDFDAHDPETAIRAIDKQIREVYKLAAQSIGVRNTVAIEQSLAALKFLRKEYEKILLVAQVEEQTERENTPDSTVGTAPSQQIRNSAESETPVNQRPDDEQEVMSLELNPRELSDKQKQLRLLD